MTTVTGKIESATGETLHATIIFTSQSTPQFPPTIIQVNTVKRLKSNASTGLFAQALAAGSWLVEISARGIGTRFYIAVPDGSSTISIETLVTSTVQTLPGVAPYTIWNGIRAGHIIFDPVATPGPPTLAPVTYVGGRQGGLDLFEYVIVWETTEGYTLGSAGATNSPPASPNNATRVTLPSPPSRVTAVNIHRSTDNGLLLRYKLASVAPNVTYYDDWENTADFNARLNPSEVVPQFNTTAGVIFSSAGNAQLYFSSAGLRTISSLQIDGALKIPTGAESGLVQTSDAEGNATWQPPPPAGLYFITGNPNGVTTATRPAIAYDANGAVWLKTNAGANSTGWEQRL